MLNVSVNGKKQQFPKGACVADLINELSLEGKRFAVERNGEIVPKSSMASVPLADGDSVEVVIAVGGG
ncbi:MAG: sulfur carrier protein ThiS [Burkholderiales bacterium]|jgi:sulfur carrier protein|nr:sulfur carrier protein ThiS [Nitrosomonadaceae bacterium]